MMNNLTPNILLPSFCRFTASTIVIFFLTLITAIQGMAQLIIKPLPQQNVKNRPSSSIARVLTHEAMSLPFWDDFSTVKDFPDTALWIHRRSVDVTHHAINAPTINVAVFNGLTSGGRPYNVSDLLANGFTDTLTSTQIKMSEVPIAQRNTVYLSFFYQWKGNGEPPDQNDFLRVEFKNNQGTWVTAHTLYGDQNLDYTLFHPLLIPVTGDQFYHDGFQFRFRSYGRQSGPFDTWNIDYIYLNMGRSTTDIYFPDQAINLPLTSIFGEYRSVPVWHFLETKQLSPATFGISNLNNAPEPLTYRVQATFKNYVNSTTPIITNKRVGPSTTSIDPSPILANERRIETMIPLPNPNNSLEFHPDAGTIDIRLRLRLFTGDVADTLGVTADDYHPRYIPIDFRSNDTISDHYVLKNYYAYDDGIAEYSASVVGVGTRIAYRFDMLRAQPDTLVAFAINSPLYGSNNTQTLDMYIYEDEGGVPKEHPLLTLNSRTLVKNATGSFDTIRFEPVLVSGTFYIGIKKPVSSDLDIGLDKDNDAGDKIYYNANGIWHQNIDLTGSLMIRPLFGSGTIVTTGLPDEASSTRIYPVPSQGIFYMEGNVHDVEIMDVTGRLVAYILEYNPERSKIILNSPVPGFYLVRWKERNNVYTKKIIVQY